MARPRKNDSGPTRTADEAAQFRNDKEAEYVDQLAGLMEERAELNAQMAKIRQDAKDAGLNSTLLQAAAKRKLEDSETRDKRLAFEAELQSLTARLGILASTPLGEAALHS
jgi:uncharacterized protein (UPF0335 family)